MKITDIKAVKTHNPFAVNDVAIAKKKAMDVMKMNNNGSSLIYGHPREDDGRQSHRRDDRWRSPSQVAVMACLQAAPQAIPQHPHIKVG